MQGQKHVQYFLTYVWLLSVTKDNSFRNLLNTFKHHTVFHYVCSAFPLHSLATYTCLRLDVKGKLQYFHQDVAADVCKVATTKSPLLLEISTPYSYRHLGKNAFLLHIPFFLYLFLRFEFCTARIDTLHILPFLHVLLGIVSCRFFYLALRVFLFFLEFFWNVAILESSGEWPPKCVLLHFLLSLCCIVWYVLFARFFHIFLACLFFCF